MNIVTVPLETPLLRGDRSPRVALVGRVGTGKSTIFQAAASTSVRHEHLDGTTEYEECPVDVGLDQITLIDLPSLGSLHALDAPAHAVLRYLIGDADNPAPAVIVLVADATTLERDLEVALELSLLGRPMVLAVNRCDEARHKGLAVNTQALAEKLGIPVVATVAHMGTGLIDLFAAAVDAARRQTCLLPLTTHAPHVNTPEDLHAALADALHAERHHRAALLFEAASTPVRRDAARPWLDWLDELFLHPRWGLIGCLGVFALVLFCVFEVSAVLDGLTSARLGAWVQEWQPDSTAGVVGRAVADGLVGLVGIVVPYMLPLVLLLVALEESGIMHRVAFVVDRGFHHIGLHGGVALPFLIGLGCNVPAISAAAATASGRDRVVAALLIVFVPCSARSAIILALGGKYLGGFGVFALFALTLVLIATLGHLLAKRYRRAEPGLLLAIPPYALPQWRNLLRNTWERTSDILTIVTPLLVAGSVVLALLSHWGADVVINTLLTPVTSWWLGLPVALGVPILFGVLRKELSLLMISQALGVADAGDMLDWVQIATFLVFLTFYVPCLSTFAVMLKTLGRREAWLSVWLSIGAALAVALAIRLPLEALRALG